MPPIQKFPGIRHLSGLAGYDRRIGSPSYVRGAYVTRYSGAKSRSQQGEGSTLTLYGPYKSLLAAYEANMYAQSEASVDAYFKKHPGVLPQGVGPWLSGAYFYDANELQSMAEDPGSVDLKKVIFKPPSSLKAHASWKGLRLQFHPHNYFMYLYAKNSKWVFQPGYAGDPEDAEDA